MERFSFSPGNIIQYGTRQYRLSEVIDDRGFFLEPLNSNKLAHFVPRSEIEKSWAKGKIEFVAKSADPAPIIDFSHLPESRKAEAQRRLKYVQVAHRVAQCGGSKSDLRNQISTVSDSIEDPAPPSVQTVTRWRKTYRSSGESILALVPSTHMRGGPGRRRLHPHVQEIIKEAIEDIYMTEQRNPVTEVAFAVRKAINDANAKRKPGEQLDIPSDRSIYNYVEDFDLYDRLVQRYGRRIGNIKYNQTGQGIAVTRALERVEIDHTKIDLMVIDEERCIPLGRPWLTLAFDRMTKVVVGFHLGFTNPSYLSVMYCLRHCFTPKADLKERFPSIENEWPVYGIMETLVCDNGKEFHARALEDVAAQLGIMLEFNGPQKPWHKAAVERFLGTLNRKNHTLPGATFSSPADREDYDPIKTASLGLRELEETISKWICDFYHHKFHRGIKTTPMAAWIAATKHTPPMEVPRRIDHLTAIMGREYERKIHHYGIEFYGLLYNSERLAKLRHRVGTVLVKVNEGDLGEIHVVDESTGELIAVPCTTPEYACGLGLWTHKVVRRHAIKLGLSNQNSDELAAALDHIRRAIDDNMRGRRRKIGSMQKAARFFEGASVPRQAALPAAPPASSCATASVSTPEPIEPEELMGAFERSTAEDA